MRKKTFIRHPTFPNVYIDIFIIKKFLTFTRDNLYCVRLIYSVISSDLEDITFTTLHEQQEFFNKLKKCFRILE